MCQLNGSHTSRTPPAEASRWPTTLVPERAMPVTSTRRRGVSCAFNALPVAADTRPDAVLGDESDHAPRVHRRAPCEPTVVGDGQVVMDDLRGRDVHNPPAVLMHSQAPVDVLDVEVVPGVHRTDVVDRLSTGHEAGAEHPVDIPRLAVV